MIEFVEHFGKILYDLMEIPILKLSISVKHSKLNVKKFVDKRFFKAERNYSFPVLFRRDYFDNRAFVDFIPFRFRDRVFCFGRITICAQDNFPILQS